MHQKCEKTMAIIPPKQMGKESKSRLKLMKQKWKEYKKQHKDSVKWSQFFEDFHKIDKPLLKLAKKTQALIIKMHDYKMTYY